MEIRRHRFCFALRHKSLCRVIRCSILLKLTVVHKHRSVFQVHQKDRLALYLDVTSFDLSQDDVDAILALDQGLRFNDPGFYLKD